MVSLATLVLKIIGYALSLSAALLGDVAESVVHLAAVGFSLFSAYVAAKPADQDHPYGHAKIVFFAAGLEGMLVLTAAVVAIGNAGWTFLHGGALNHWEWGLVMSLVAGGINGAWGWWLRRTGRRDGHYLLEAQGEHLMADGWTSLGAAIGLILAGVTGARFWDVLAAVLVGGHVFWSGLQLVWNSGQSLMDRADPQVNAVMRGLLEREGSRLDFIWHRLRHRPMGESHWIDVHLLFADDMTLMEAHQRASEFEAAVRAHFGPSTQISTHLEPRRGHTSSTPGREA